MALLTCQQWSKDTKIDVNGRVDLSRHAYFCKRAAPECRVKPEIPEIHVFDTGIYQRFLRLDITRILTFDRIEQVNKGALAELFVALELKKAATSNAPVELHYWRREKDGSSAEVDFVIQRNKDIVPVEVKSGTKGRFSKRPPRRKCGEVYINL